MTSETVITSRPSLPVRPPAKVTIAPPKPPSLPGVKPVANTQIAPSRVPGTPRVQTPPTRQVEAAKAAEVGRRRAALADSGIGDPKSTIAMLLTGAKNTAKALPLLLKKYWWLILIVGGVWIFAQSFDPVVWGNKVPALRGFFETIKPGVDFLVFLTAAYNGWIAKTVYGLVILKIFVPLVQRIRVEGFGPVMASFKSVPPGVKSSWVESGAVSLSLFVLATGIGLALTNLLSGNNSYTRSIASIALTLSMVKVLSDSKRSTPFMATRVISKDVFKLFKKDTPVKNHHIFLCITGVMAGLSSSIIFALIVFQRGTPGPIEFAGYWIGLGLLVAGVVLYFVKVRGKQSLGQTTKQAQ